MRHEAARASPWRVVYPRHTCLRARRNGPSPFVILRGQRFQPCLEGGDLRVTAGVIHRSDHFFAGLPRGDVLFSLGQPSRQDPQFRGLGVPVGEFPPDVDGAPVRVDGSSEMSGHHGEHLSQLRQCQPLATSVSRGAADLNGTLLRGDRVIGLHGPAEDGREAGTEAVRCGADGALVNEGRAR